MSAVINKKEAMFQWMEWSLQSSLKNAMMVKEGYILRDRLSYCIQYYSYT